MFGIGRWGRWQSSGCPTPSPLSIDHDPLGCQLSASYCQNLDLAPRVDRPVGNGGKSRSRPSLSRVRPAFPTTMYCPQRDFCASVGLDTGQRRLVGGAKEGQSRPRHYRALRCACRRRLLMRPPHLDNFLSSTLRQCSQPRVFSCAPSEPLGLNSPPGTLPLLSKHSQQWRPIRPSTS